MKVHFGCEISFPDFTCGPTALMMAMKALNSELETIRKLEVRILDLFYDFRYTAEVLSVEEILEKFTGGSIPIVLISSYRIILNEFIRRLDLKKSGDKSGK